MGLSPPNGSASHPGNYRHQRNLHSDFAATHPPPFPERKERNIPPSRLRPELRRKKSLPTNLLMPSPPSRAHPGDSRPGRANRIIAAPNPSIFLRTRKCPAAGNEDKSSPGDGAVWPVKERSGRSAGPEVPRNCVNPRSQALNKELCKLAGDYLREEILICL